LPEAASILPAAELILPVEVSTSLVEEPIKMKTQLHRPPTGRRP
jgi:hypothetical protein